ncbi:AMP-binding protein, partial [Acidimicrobiaceae bacterium USS-CC1]|nr:AMP-binding protein [Acidiferrimicrobium australe]
MSKLAPGGGGRGAPRYHAAVSDWNLAEVWETVAEERPAAEALVWGPRRWTWAELDRRADGVAGALLAAGLGRQAKVAQYLLNGPEYLESLFGAAKAGMVPVNTNYRYAEDELAYLWDNADVEAVVFDVSFAERAAAVRPRVPAVRLWLAVGAGPVPPWAVAYEDAVAAA